MRRLALSALVLGVGLALGCGKKPAPPDEAAKGEPDKVAPPAKGEPDEATLWRDRQLAGLRSGSAEVRRTACDELSWLVNENPTVGPLLLDMMRDRGMRSRTVTNQLNSTREAAAVALLKSGPKGEALLKEKGLAILREGLSDPLPAVREHTAYTVGVLGPLAKPLAGDVQKLCADKDANVRRVAFEALRVTGVADPVALAKLMSDPDDETAGLAAELVSLVPDMPAGAVAPLSDALASTNPNVRTAAAKGLAAAGPKAAPAVPALIDAITKHYPKEYDAKAHRAEGWENALWLALARAGEPAVAPVAKLLTHTNMAVKSLAARTLGEIGEPARSAKDALRRALADATINVSAEAAVALCKLGEAQGEAANLIKTALDVPTQGVAGYAIEAITRMGDTGKPLVPLALAKLTDQNPYTRFAAVSLVGTLPPDEATKHAADVGKLATDAEPDIRRLVARVLEKLGPSATPAADALGAALATEKELDIREQFVDALVAMGPGAKPAVPALLPVAASKDLSVVARGNVFAAVVAADPASPAVAATLVKAAADDDPAVRAAAAVPMGQLNPLPPDALATLVKLAKSDARNGPRVAALRALTVAGPRAKPARADLESIATGPQPGLAIWAKAALAAVDGDVKKAAPLIRAGLNDRNAAVRSSAADALLVVGPGNDDLPALLKLLGDRDSTTRSAAATACGLIGPAAKDAVPPLARLLDDDQAAARLAAAEALGRIGPAAQPALEKLKLLRGDPTVRTAAQRAVEKIGGK